MWQGICYKVLKTPKTFSRAASTCRRDGGTLAMPRDAETNAFLLSLFTSDVRDKRAVWFGLHDQREEGSFGWVDGSEIGTYNCWATGQPDNKGGIEDCVCYSAYTSRGRHSYREYNYKWKDAPCEARIRFICQVVPGRP
ncbi:collectin-10-like [Branchiostoma floridae x Branchiostoma japonicum]